MPIFHLRLSKISANERCTCIKSSLSGWKLAIDRKWSLVSQVNECIPQKTREASKKITNTLRPRQNGRHFPDDIFKCIFLNENVWISIKISLEFVPKDPINYIPALLQIMAWCRPGDKPSSEPMMVSLLTHICVTRPPWVKIMYCIMLIYQCEVLLGLVITKSNKWWYSITVLTLTKMLDISHSMWCLCEYCGDNPGWHSTW